MILPALDWIILTTKNKQKGNKSFLAFIPKWDIRFLKIKILRGVEEYFST